MEVTRQPRVASPLTITVLQQMKRLTQKRVLSCARKVEQTNDLPAGCCLRSDGMTNTQSASLHLSEQHDHGRRTHSSVVWIAYRQMSTTAGEGDKHGGRRWPHTGALSYQPASRRQSRKIKTCTALRKILFIVD